MKTVLMVAALVAFTAPAGAQERLADQVRKGVVEEEANQNLDKAIQTYQSIVARYDEDRKAAGTALFRLAECYRKAGKREQAVAAYQRVVREFVDQAALVESSRSQLSTLGVPDAREARPARSSASGTSESRSRAPRDATAREVGPERPRSSREATLGALDATKLELEALQKRLANEQKRVESGMVTTETYEKLLSEYAFLRQQYEQQVAERTTNETRNQAARQLTQQMIKSVEAEILLVQERIAAIQKNVAVGVTSPQDAELLQLKRDLLGLQRKLDELRVDFSQRR